MRERFIVWTGAGVVGYGAVEGEALDLAGRQAPGTTVYIRDSFLSDGAFSVVVGMAGRRSLPRHLRPAAGDGPVARDTPLVTVTTSGS